MNLDIKTLHKILELSEELETVQERFQNLAVELNNTQSSMDDIIKGIHYLKMQILEKGEDYPKFSIVYNNNIWEIDLTASEVASEVAKKCLSLQDIT